MGAETCPQYWAVLLCMHPPQCCIQIEAQWPKTSLQMTSDSSLTVLIYMLVLHYSEIYWSQISNIKTRQLEFSEGCWQLYLLYVWIRLYFKLETVVINNQLYFLDCNACIAWEFHYCFPVLTPKELYQRLISFNYHLEFSWNVSFSQSVLRIDPSAQLISGRMMDLHQHGMQSQSVLFI